MDDNGQIYAENCISGLESLDAVLARLTLDQVRFVIARQECATAREAARKVHLSESLVYRWGEDVDTALRLMAQDALITAMHIRRRMLAKAMAVKAAGLDSDDQKIQQGVATEFIEWELGRAAQTNRNKNSGEMIIRVVYDDSETDSPPPSSCGADAIQG